MLQSSSVVGCLRAVLHEAHRACCMAPGLGGEAPEAGCPPLPLAYGGTSSSHTHDRRSKRCQPCASCHQQSSGLPRCEWPRFQSKPHGSPRLGAEGRVGHALHLQHGLGLHLDAPRLAQAGADGGQRERLVARPGGQHARHQRARRRRVAAPRLLLQAQRQRSACSCAPWRARPRGGHGGWPPKLAARLGGLPARRTPTAHRARCASPAPASPSVCWRLQTHQRGRCHNPQVIRTQAQHHRDAPSAHAKGWATGQPGAQSSAAAAGPRNPSHAPSS